MRLPWRRRSAELEPVVLPAPDPAPLITYLAGQVDALRAELERRDGRERELERESAGELEQLRGLVAELERQVAELEPLAAVTLERRATDSERQRKPNPRRSRGGSPDAPRGPADAAPGVRGGPAEVPPSRDVVQAPPPLREVPQEPRSSAGAAVLRSGEPATLGALALEPEPAPPVSAEVPRMAPHAGASARGSVVKSQTPVFDVPSNPLPRPAVGSAHHAELVAVFEDQMNRGDLRLEAERVHVGRKLLELRGANHGTVAAIVAALAHRQVALADLCSALELAPTKANPAGYACVVLDQAAGTKLPRRLRPRSRRTPTTEQPAAGELEQDAAAEDADTCAVPCPAELRERFRNRSAELA